MTKPKPKDSRLVIAGEPFKAIARLFGKAGSFRPSKRRGKSA
jgi:hypothetical protein